MSPPGEMADPSKVNLTAVPNQPPMPPPMPQMGGLRGVGSGSDDSSWGMGGGIQQSDIWNPSAAVGVGQAAGTDTTTGTDASATDTAPADSSGDAVEVHDPDSGELIGWMITTQVPLPTGGVGPKQTFTKAPNAATPKNKTIPIKLADGTHLITFGPDGAVTKDEPLGASPSSTSVHPLGANVPGYIGADGQYHVNLGAQNKPVAVRPGTTLVNPTTDQPVYNDPAGNKVGTAHPVPQSDGTTHWISQVTDPQGNVVGQVDGGEVADKASTADPWTTVKVGNQSIPFNKATGQYGQPQGSAGYQPTYLSPGQSVVTFDQNGQPVLGPTAPGGQQEITAGNQIYAFDPTTRTLQPLGSVPQPQSIQDLSTPSGGHDVIGIDPYSGATSDLYHQAGEPRDMSHNIYLPGDWSGSYPTFDPAHPSQPGSAYHQGVAWNPPPTPSRPAGASSGAPAVQPPVQAPAAAAPPPPDQGTGTGVFSNQQTSPPGTAGTSADPIFGAQGFGPPPPVAPPTSPPGSPPQSWLFSNPASPIANTANTPSDSGVSPPSNPNDAPSDGSVGSGQAGPPPNSPPPMGGSPTGGGGGAWRPPIDPSQVVGTGHKFNDQVSLEGSHKGVDLQAVRGTPAKSPVDGVVVRVEHNPKGLGITVTIRDAKGHEHTLGHLGSVAVKVGQRVRVGQPVAQVGSTGASTGPHLDVREKNQQGAPVDPTAKLGALAQMPRADNGSEPAAPDPSAPPDPSQMPGMGQSWGGVGRGQDVGVGAQYTVPLQGGGFETVNASDPQAALQNVGASASGAAPIAGGNMAHQENGVAVAGSGPNNPGGLGVRRGGAGLRAVRLSRTGTTRPISSTSTTNLLSRPQLLWRKLLSSSLVFKRELMPRITATGRRSPPKPRTFVTIRRLRHCRLRVSNSSCRRLRSKPPLLKPSRSFKVVRRRGWRMLRSLLSSASRASSSSSSSKLLPYRIRGSRNSPA